MQAQYMIDAGLMKVVKILLDHKNPSIKAETFWLLSNITAGTEQHIKSCIDHDFVKKMI